MSFEYKTKGVCSSLIELDIDENDTLTFLNVHGGCNGNLQGISKLVIGRNAKVVAEQLKGIRCGFKLTSCPDQISSAIEQYYAEKQHTKMPCE